MKQGARIQNETSVVVSRSLRENGKELFVKISLELGSVHYIAHAKIVSQKYRNTYLHPVWFRSNALNLARILNKLNY